MHPSTAHPAGKEAGRAHRCSKEPASPQACPCTGPLTACEAVGGRRRPRGAGDTIVVTVDVAACRAEAGCRGADARVARLTRGTVRAGVAAQARITVGARLAHCARVAVGAGEARGASGAARASEARRACVAVDAGPTRPAGARVSSARLAAAAGASTVALGA